MNMNTLYYVGAAAFAVVLIIFLVKVLAAPIKAVFKLICHAALGFVLLIAVNLVGGFLNFSVPITLVTILVSGIGGVPGVILVVLYCLIF